MANSVDRSSLIELESFSVDMARECGRILRQYSQNFVNVQFKDRYETGLKLHSIKLWETPTSYALYEIG